LLLIIITCNLLGLIFVSLMLKFNRECCSNFKDYCMTSRMNRS